MTSYQEDYYDRVYDYQRVPASLPPPLPQGPSLAKRSRSSSHSSGHRRSRERTHLKSSRAHSTNSTTAKLRMEELQVIKRELTLIKTQIDGLLDSLDRMDTQRNDHRGSPLREDSPAVSPYPLSASSSECSPSPHSPSRFRHRIQRESPELGEATDDDHHTKPWINSDIQLILKERTATLKTGNRDCYKEARHTRQGLQAIVDYKPKPGSCNNTIASLLDGLNRFCAHFEYNSGPPDNTRKLVGPLLIKMSNHSSDLEEEM
ncbi:heterogeneous nuclear ribonucleoproteins C1/C2-like [Lampris incognitus]|uniref:heterogeneous nuclear ribonucleoproteins C1/C2-like n=1 Tax=Lampris incognitus TaxID=2546036 RepID=UPI0024B5623A|nr:heterogeneous nuclear ribonucleoproteins C1/C2-like [Lampris incognitus]